MIMGTVIGLARRKKLRGEIELVESVYIDRKTGLSGDIRGTALNRQVTLLSKRSWTEVCRELKEEIPWTFRRANILIDNFDLFKNLVIKSKLVK